MQIISQGIGFIAVGTGFFIYIQKNRTNLLLFKLITDLLWIIHFLLIGALPAMATMVVAIFREILFIKRDKYPILKSRGILVLLCLFFLTSALIFWKGPHSLIPAVASCLATIGFFNEKVSNIRWISLMVSILMFLNGVLFNSIANIFNEIITVTSIVIGTLKTKKGE